MAKEINYKVLAIVFGLIAILLLLYVGYGKYIDMIEKKEMNAFDSGFKSAIDQMAQQAALCNQIPLIFGNQTVTLFAVECVQGG